MNRKMTELNDRYREYAGNLLDLDPADVAAGVDSRRMMAVGLTATP